MPTSPRNIAGPVVRGHDLWGRRDDIETLWGYIERGSVLLAGPRRYGKSSVMYALAEQARPGWTATVVDVEYLDSAPEFLTVLTAELLANAPLRSFLQRARALPRSVRDWMGNLLDEVSCDVPNLGEIRVRLRQQAGGTDGWEELATQTFNALQEAPTRLCLIVDEFPMMLASMLDRSEEDGLKFLRWLRTCRQSARHQGLRFVLGGSLNIEPRLERLGCEAVLGDLQRYRFSPLTPERARAFVADLLNGEGYEYQPGVPECIVETTNSGVHFFLQVTIQECLLAARQAGRPLLLADVERVYRERVVGPEGRHRFSHYHTRLKDYGAAERPARIVLYSLCRETPVTMRSLQDILARYDISTSSLEDVLVRLEGDYYVIRDADNVLFADGLVRDWWLRNVPAPT